MILPFIVFVLSIPLEAYCYRKGWYKTANTIMILSSVYIGIMIAYGIARLING